MRVVFRVDASVQIGTGHVMRCLTLATTLKDSGADVDFICRQHEGNLINTIRKNGFHVFELIASARNKVDTKLAHSPWLGATQQQDACDCINVLKGTQVGWLVVDHYGIDEDWQQALKPYYDKLLVIDDLADRQHQCDILLDQTFGRESQDYVALVPGTCELLLSSKYALLRSEFTEWRQYSLKRRQHLEFKQLLINMGGVDVYNITEQVLLSLKDCVLPDNLNIVVVMGTTAPHLESVKAIAGTLPYAVEVKVGVNNMAEIMANADIAIGASGATTWERCCLGLPSIQIVLAENQRIIAKLLEKDNAIKFLQDIKHLPKVLENVKEWMGGITQISQQVSDGLGANRVLNKIIKQ